MTRLRKPPRRLLELVDGQQRLATPASGSQRAGNRYVLHPDQVRGLSPGEAFLFHRGPAVRSRLGGTPVLGQRRVRETSVG